MGIARLGPRTGAALAAGALGWARCRAVQAQTRGGADQERRALEGLSVGATQGKCERYGMKMMGGCFFIKPFGS